MSIEHIRDAVHPAFDQECWNHHIVLVHKYCLLLAEQLHAKKEVVELAAYLHDYGRVAMPDREHEHHLTGADLAQEILEKEGYDAETIRHVQACIRTHRGSVDLKPDTLEAQIVANADAMAHVDALPWLFKVRYAKGESPQTATAWLQKKLERNWAKKLTLPEARALVKEKYAAAMLLLNSGGRESAPDA